MNCYSMAAVVTHMLAHGAELIGQMQYENAYRNSKDI